MNKKVSTLLALGMTACSIQALSTPPRTAPPVVVRALPLEGPPIAKHGKGLPLPRTCYLGSDCLTMVSEPFEICQLSTIKSCGDKLAEVMQVETPKGVAKPAPPLQRTSR
jgi:hypothetical protein